jgi:uncharacterized protein Veg
MLEFYNILKFSLSPEMMKTEKAREVFRLEIKLKGGRKSYAKAIFKIINDWVSVFKVDYKTM